LEDFMILFYGSQMDIGDGLSNAFLRVKHV
jgi:hypothetical protein